MFQRILGGARRLYTVLDASGRFHKIPPCSTRFYLVLAALEPIRSPGSTPLLVEDPQVTYTSPMNYPGLI